MQPLRVVKHLQDTKNPKEENRVLRKIGEEVKCLASSGAHVFGADRDGQVLSCPARHAAAHSFCGAVQVLVWRFETGALEHRLGKKGDVIWALDVLQDSFLLCGRLVPTLLRRCAISSLSWIDAVGAARSWPTASKLRTSATSGLRTPAVSKRLRHMRARSARQLL